MGFAEGRVAALSQVRDDVASAMEALASAVDQLERRDGLGLAEVPAGAVELALAIAEAVIGREVSASQSPGADALARAIVLAPDRGPLDARLHPLDIETLHDVDALAPGRELRLHADPSIERGGCILEVGPARIDAQIGAALERVRAELLGAELLGTEQPGGHLGGDSAHRAHDGFDDDVMNGVGS